MIEKTYLLTDTLFDVVNSGLLKVEIEKKDEITKAIKEIVVTNATSNFVVRFKEALPSAQEAELDAVVAAHNGFLSQGEDPAEVTVNLGDGRARVSLNDSTEGFLKDKIVPVNNKVSVSENDDGTDERLLVGINPQNIGTGELNNDANFINASQAPVQPNDISNFETSTQLDARDTNNRNRANHSGSQPASTISDFLTAVKNAETTTSLGFNPVTNILSFTNESGNVQDIDLSQFLDDTNLAQIVSGTLNQSTGIVTFTRDDNSTFTVDFSSLNDQGAINTAISTHEQSVANHSDVDLTNIQVGQSLVWNGSSFVPGSSVPFKDFARTNSPAGTQSTNYQQYLRLSTNVPKTGLYKISWDSLWSYNNTQSNFEARVQIDDNTNVEEFVKEPQDSGGSGVTVTNLEGGTFNSGTDQRDKYNGFDVVNLTAGAHNIDLDLACQVEDNEATFYRALITIEEWN